MVLNPQLSCAQLAPSASRPRCSLKPLVIASALSRPVSHFAQCIMVLVVRDDWYLPSYTSRSLHGIDIMREQNIASCICAPYRQRPYTYQRACSALIAYMGPTRLRSVYERRVVNCTLTRPGDSSLPQMTVHLPLTLGRVQHCKTTLHRTPFRCAAVTAPLVMATVDIK